MSKAAPLDVQRVEFHGYAPLIEVLNEAAVQAAHGKGHERHSGGKPFIHQPLLEITRRYGLGFPFGQVEKKLEEANRMVGRGQIDAAIREMLGAINYIAGAVIVLNEQKPDEVAKLRPSVAEAL